MLHDSSFLGEEIRGNIMSNKEPCMQVCVLGRKKGSEVNVTENLINFLKIEKKAGAPYPDFLLLFYHLGFGVKI